MIISLKSTKSYVDRQMLKLFEISDSLKIESPVLDVGSIRREKTKPCPSPSRKSESITPEST